MMQVRRDEASGTGLVLVWDDLPRRPPLGDVSRAAEALFSILDKTRHAQPPLPVDAPVAHGRKRRAARRSVN